MQAADEKLRFIVERAGVIGNVRARFALVASENALQ